jgi:amino acid adenylation domain-containing protein
VALLGIMKAGGAYVPIDPQVPQARLEFMLADADVTVLVTQQELSSSTAGTTIVFLDADWSNIAALPATDLQQASSADNLAYVIYTSGSTGLPKGVMVPHRNVVALVNALLPRLDVKDRDVWTLVHSIAFDFSVWEIWGALLSGAKLVVVPELIVSSPAEFEELLRREQVTVINQTPSAAAQLLGAGNGDSWQARGSAVKQVFVGGEALSADLAHSLIAMGAPVWNFYGPTEATVWAALKLLSADDEEVTVGRPISNWQLYVLDHRHELLPVGVPGELYIGGEGLARGYLNRADLTAEKFIPNPYGGSARLYRTGDVARYKPNGDIRSSGQVTRLSNRARRSGSSAVRASASKRGSGFGARATERRSPTRRLRGYGRTTCKRRDGQQSSADRVGSESTAEVHGACNSGCHGPTATHEQRQDRSQGIAGTRLHNRIGM